MQLLYSDTAATACYFSIHALLFAAAAAAAASFPSGIFKNQIQTN